MAEKQDSIVYTFEKVYYKNPPLRVPGVGALADSTGIHPMYFPSGDQEFLLLKGPVVKGVTKSTDGAPASFALDDNGWYMLSLNKIVEGFKLKRDPKHNNRIVSGFPTTEEYSNLQYKYDEEGWLLEEVYDVADEFVNTDTYQHNMYHDPLAKVSTMQMAYDGPVTVDKYIYTMTEMDCFHNWLERDVAYYEKGVFKSKWHESRTLYYLNVIDKNRGSNVTRPFTGKQRIGLINSNDGGRMFFYHGTKWKYVRIWGRNERKTYMKSGMALKSISEKPIFPGGQDSLNTYLQKNLQYPEVALKDNVQGTVKVKFKVSETGEIEDIEVTKSVSKELDEEAVRLIQNMKHWTPGKEDGEIVKTTCTLPLIFSIAQQTEEELEEQAKKPQKGEIAGHSHEYKVMQKAGGMKVKKEGNNFLYEITVTTIKKCTSCGRTEQVGKPRVERFSTSREANEFRKSLSHSDE